MDRLERRRGRVKGRGFLCRYCTRTFSGDSVVDDVDLDVLEPRLVKCSDLGGGGSHFQLAVPQGSGRP